MAIDQAGALATWLNAPELTYDWEFVSVYLEDEGIAVPEGMDEDEIGEWLRESEHATDYEVWFDDRASELVYDGRVDWTPPTIYSDARTESGWFIHFTDGDFITFADGVDRYHLGNSGTQKSDRTIRCPANLTADPDKALWVHAWEVFAPHGNEGLNDQMLRGGLGYGHNALLFRSDEAVVANHAGHEEEHALVLGCSEYDAIQLRDLSRVWNDDKSRDTIAGTAVLKGGDVDFDDLEDFVDALNEERRKSKSVAGLSGGRRRSRWHRLAVPARR
jgi:hypothetical protein